MTFKCKNCNDYFELPVEDKRIRFCSEECYLAFHKYKPKKPTDRKCKQCGVGFKTVKENQVFCSKLCKRNFEKKKWFITHDHHKRKCKNCFRWFETTDSRKSYCSEGCKLEAKRKRNQLRYWKNKRRSYEAEVPGLE